MFMPESDRLASQFHYGIKHRCTDVAINGTGRFADLGKHARGMGMGFRKIIVGYLRGFIFTVGKRRFWLGIVPL